ncbi:MAG: hypothetical protein ACKOKF_12660, partial [Bacteroidota bacterium]
VCFDGNYNQALEQALKNGISLPRSGQNLLGVRVKDRDGLWGPAFKTVVNADSTDTNRSFTRRRVRRAEFWFDRDPGDGNGTLMNIADGYGDQPLETVIRNNLPLLPNGVHLLGVRVQDRDNTWGPSFKTTVSVDTLAQNSFQVYTNPSYTRKCAGSSVTMRALGAVSYVWSPATGLNTTTGDSVVATPAATITYTVVGTNASSQQDTAYVTVEIQQPAAITASRPLIFCQGDSTVLTSNVAVGNFWNTGAYTQSITVKSTGTYLLTTDNECGVTTATLTVVNQTPVISATITPVSCNGGSNGSISLSVNSDTVAATNNPGLLISEVFTNPSGNDSPFEWVELVATDYIDFSVKPYTVIMSNNGPASSKGWVQGGTPTVVTNSTYAFQINSGAVTPGQVVYVGGSSMAPTGTKLRVINTATTSGDGGLGGAFLSTGVLGNGG